MINLLKNFFNLIYLPHCYQCGKLLSDNEILFDISCKNKLDLIKLDSVCPICLGKIVDGKCQNCHNIDFHFKKIFSLYYFNNEMKNLILNLKYHNKPLIGIMLGEFIGNDILEKINSLDLTNAILIPVPLNFFKKIIRGYNQAEKIALGISKTTNIKLIKNGLRRVSYTKTQTKLNRQEREKNLENVFQINEKIMNKFDYDTNIFLVDDVFTTGSTLNQCAKALKNFGFINIYGITVCRAHG